MEDKKNKWKNQKQPDEITSNFLWRWEKKKKRLYEKK